MGREKRGGEEVEVRGLSEKEREEGMRRMTRRTQAREIRATESMMHGDVDLGSGTQWGLKLTDTYTPCIR